MCIFTKAYILSKGCSVLIRATGSGTELKLRAPTQDTRRSPFSESDLGRRLAMGPSYLSLSTWTAKALGYQAVSDKDGRVLGGDGQTLLQNLNQAGPKAEDSLRMVGVELQVVDFLGDCPQPQDAFLVVPDLELHKLQRENAKGIEDDTQITPSLLVHLFKDGELLGVGKRVLG